MYYLLKDKFHLNLFHKNFYEKDLPQQKKVEGLNLLLFLFPHLKKIVSITRHSKK